jgi:uncharacterized protein DUF4406
VTVEFSAEDVRFTLLPLVYLAGPYAKPDPVVNTRNAITVAERLAESGRVVCHIPHLTLLHHLVAPHPVDHWYAWDLAVLSRCDAVYRMPGQSTGADREAAFGEQMGVPVFDSEEALLEWAADEWVPGEG